MNPFAAILLVIAAALDGSYWLAGGIFLVGGFMVLVSK